MMRWSATRGLDLGPQVKFHRFLAGARKKLWWMTPEWGSNASSMPPETQFLLLELEEGGPYAALLPLIDSNTFRGTLRKPKCAYPGPPFIFVRLFCVSSLLLLGKCIRSNRLKFGRFLYRSRLSRLL